MTNDETVSVNLTREEIEILGEMVRVRVIEASYREQERKYVAIYSKLLNAAK